MDDVTILFEGIGEGAEFWGGTQANLVVHRPGGAAREIGILLTLQASTFLAQQQGVEETDEFRTDAARSIGEAWIRAQIEHDGHLPAYVIVSVDMLKKQPGLFEGLAAPA